MQDYLPELYDEPQPVVPMGSATNVPSATSYPSMPPSPQPSTTGGWRGSASPYSEHNKPNPERALRKKKQAMQRDMMRMAGDAYVHECFQDQDFEYNVSHNKKATVLSVRIQDDKWAEFRLLPGKADEYMEELRTIPERVENLKELLGNMNGDITIVKHHAH